MTELERPGFSVEGIAAFPPDRLVSKDTGARQATVSIVAGGEAKQTMLTFTNKVTPKGFLEVCKEKPNYDKLDGYFNFTVSQPGSRPQTVTVRVGACSRAIQLKPGLATITEVARTGAELVDISTVPDTRLVSKSLRNGSATVTIVPGSPSTQTMVTFTNKKVTPPPTTGRVKICKKAGPGVDTGTPFTFTLATLGNKSVTVEASECSSAQIVPFGKLTVTKKATLGLEVSDITVDPPTARVGSPNLITGTVTVDVKADQRVVTEVEFTNKATSPGSLKVCRIPGPGVVPRTPFSFTVGTRSVTVPAGYRLPLALPGGKVEITEAATRGLQVTDITVTGAGGLISKDLGAGKVTVHVAPGQITEVLYTNAKPSKPVVGCVKPWKHYWKDRRVVDDLVPRGGLTVGGSQLSAAQTHGMLQMAQRSSNFRFEFQGELVAALLNQLAGASTPAEVQAAIDAAQLLTSQGGGSYHHGSVNTGKMSWSAPVTYKGKTYKAHQLADTLGNYNEGSSHGGPRWCRKQGGHDKDKPWDDKDDSWGGKDHPWGGKPDRHNKHQDNDYGTGTAGLSGFR